VNQSKKVYFISGEASGDLHGSNLIKELLAQKTKDVDIDIRFWGGDKMEDAVGKKPVKHFKELAFMGFLEVIMNLKTILRNISFCKRDILEFKPDVLVLIDYPGFNLRIAEWAKKEGIKVLYYISPTVWAWKEKRVFKIKRVVDKMYVILPFEKPFYAKHDYEVEYVGHPLLDAIKQFEENKFNSKEFKVKHNINENPVIAVLPGSRKQEIRKKLPVMLKALESFSKYQIIIAGAPSLEKDFYLPFIDEKKDKIIFGKTYELLKVAEAALVTSGTATLETALLNIPQVVCYKTSAISYHIAKRLVNIKYISLVNLILDKESVKELIQGDCTESKINSEFKRIVIGGDKRRDVLDDYQSLKKVLGEGGASKKLASLMLSQIVNK
jgi:lipid-A-disaccharide synthase